MGMWGAARVARRNLAFRFGFCMILTGLVLVLNGVPVGLAQVSPADRIDQVEVVGTQRIEPATVMSYMDIQAGDGFDAGRLDSSLKALFETGLFADVTIRREGPSLIVQVVENPIINRIAFEGNDRLKDDVLESEVSLRPRVVFTRTRVQSDTQRLLDLYRRTGRFAATVDPQVIQLEQNRVDLVFEIDEGPATGVRAINFIGNSRFSDRSLRGVVQTRESAFWRFLSTDDTYDPDRLSFDRELLRQFYLSEGYADFRVVSSVAELTPDQEDFIITFTVEEGEAYIYGEVGVESSLRDVSSEELEELLLTVAGDRYNAEEVDQTVELITEVVGAKGFAFVDVRPRARRDPEALTLDVIFEVDEGERVFVERIDVEGNLRTLDKVIRRELELVEGDAFNSAKLRRSRQRLANLGFFRDITVSSTQGSASDLTNITVAVQEQSTGELSVGAGFSTSGGALTDITLRESNLLGRGQDLRLGVTLAQTRQQVDLSFTEPYFLDRNVSAGGDIFHRLSDFSDQSSFEQRETGFAVRSGYQLTEDIRHNVRYTLRQDEITQVEDTASRVVRSQEGEFITSSVSSSLFFDRLDKRFNPTDGFFARHDIDVAGLAGDVHYVRNTLASGFFKPIFGDLIVGVDGEVGYIVGLGEDVRLVDRFFLGGDDLRGFESAGVGPRDLSTDDAIGGNIKASGTVSVDFPLGLPEEVGIRGNIFSDFGVLTGSEESGAGLTDTGTLRASIGVGFGWQSPFGPIRLDLAKALVKENHDKTEVLRFSFGTRF